MNYAEKMELECRLLTNLASWMERRGRVLTDRSQSNPYCGIRVREIEWRGIRYEVVDVDGMTCQIHRQ